MNYSSITTITLNHKYANVPCDWAEIIPSDETKKFLQQEQLIAKINGNTIFILGDSKEHANEVMEFFFCVRIKNQNVGTATLHKKTVTPKKEPTTPPKETEASHKKTSDEPKPPVYALFGRDIPDNQKINLLADKIKYPFFKTNTCFGIDLKLLVREGNQAFHITLKSISAYWRYRFPKSICESIKNLEIINKTDSNNPKSNVIFHSSTEGNTYVFTSQNPLPLSLAPEYHFHLRDKESKKDLFGCLPNLDTRYLIKKDKDSKDLRVEYFFNH